MLLYSFKPNHPILFQLVFLYFFHLFTLSVFPGTTPALLFTTNQPDTNLAVTPAPSWGKGLHSLEAGLGWS